MFWLINLSRLGQLGLKLSNFFLPSLESGASRDRFTDDNIFFQAPEWVNRTIQEDLAEELRRFPHNVQRLNRVIIPYLTYYNEQRPHLGLERLTPSEVLLRS